MVQIVQIATISTADQCSWQISIATAGTAVPGPDVGNPNGFWLKAHPDNADAVWIGNDGSGDVTNANGYPLDPGESVLISVTNLKRLRFDSDVNTEVICWHRA